MAHNGSIVPVPGRDLFVQAWYQGGVSVIDFTDSANPVEIAYFDRGPIDAEDLILGGYWSTYWYNGRIYESDITRGLIIWNLSDSAVAGAKRFDHSNPQTQETSFAFKGTAFGTDDAAAAAAFAALTANAPSVVVEEDTGGYRFDSGD